MRVATRYTQLDIGTSLYVKAGAGLDDDNNGLLTDCTSSKRVMLLSSEPVPQNGSCITVTLQSFVICRTCGHPHDL